MICVDHWIVNPNFYTEVLYRFLFKNALSLQNFRIFASAKETEKASASSVFLFAVSRRVARPVRRG